MSNARYLIAAGDDVREVPAHLTFPERNRRPSRGKSDPDDAVAIAQVLLRDHDGLASAKRDALADDLKALVDPRDQLARLCTQQPLGRVAPRRVRSTPVHRSFLPGLSD